jgi:hypothetical protein
MIQFASIGVGEQGRVAVPEGRGRDQELPWNSPLVATLAADES